MLPTRPAHATDLRQLATDALRWLDTWTLRVFNPPLAPSAGDRALTTG